MRAVVVMFDTLNRKMLPPYGNTTTHAPNFTRLAARSTVFDNAYGGSMPCMPARRELHTGRYNFLHRSWGPLEPFDDSVPELLRAAGVYAHLTTDHYHYWEDGGATYHQRFSSFELFRGHEGDKWKGIAGDIDLPAKVEWRAGAGWRQDVLNRAYLESESDHPQTRTFDAGLEFIRANARDDDWYLHLETFDPHEPFFSYERHQRWYEDGYEGPRFDWPDYKRVTESKEEAGHLRNRYSALLTMCDHSLGRVLDVFDELGLWDDTMLIVCTDHGFLLGEHGWWGKNVQPWYDENIHLPLFVWDPRSPAAGGRRDELVQTIDLGPTLLDFFGVPLTPDMQGRPISRLAPGRAGLFGAYGGHVNVTDGRYVYMRACADPSNGPLYEYTLMPTHMSSRFDPAELRDASLVPPMPFTKGVPMLRVPGFPMGDPYRHGTMLFDLVADPAQDNPLIDDETELRMAALLVGLMRATDSPPEQFQRLGLPVEGDVTVSHLLARAQRHLVDQRNVPPPDPAGHPESATLFRRLADIPGAIEAVSSALGTSFTPAHLAALAETSPVRYAATLPGIGDAELSLLDARLAPLLADDV
ncbi:sulfatase [Actinoplanes sp. NPDC051411]|uniref:sulfatase n=1 Tax=Actinoplanes sp. NPDC051411 TaxID=3155522 RepID=UPI0034213268